MEFNGSGTLYIRAFTAGGALPVEGVLVRIRGTDEENRLVEYSVLTDKDGLTEKISLPAPDKSYSLSSGASESAYATYEVEIFGGGFYRKHFFNVAVFDGTDSFQPVAMIPLASVRDIKVFPEGNLTAIGEQNENL